MTFSPFPSELVPTRQKEDEQYGKQEALAIKGAWENGGVSPVSPADRPWYELLHLYYVGRQPNDQYIAQYRGTGGLRTRENAGAVSISGDSAGLGFPTPEMSEFFRRGLNNISFEIVSTAPKLFGTVRSLLNEADQMVDVESLSPEAVRQKEEAKWRKYYSSVVMNPVLSELGIAVSRQEWSPRSMEEIELYERFHGIKLGFETGLHRVIQHGFSISNWPDLFEKFKESVIKYNFVCGRVCCNSEGAVVVEYIDPSDYITAYLDKQPSEEPPYAGHVVRRKVGDIAPILKKKYGATDDQILSLARRHCVLNGYADPEGFDYNQCEPVTRRFLWYDWWVPVLCFEFRSRDQTRYNRYQNSKGEDVYKEQRVHHTTETDEKTGKVYNRYYYNTDNNRTGLDVLGSESVYCGEWVMDTDWFLSYGRQTNIIKNSDGTAALSYFHYHIPGQSLVERVKPQLDAYVMDWYKLQAACLEASPDGFIIDKGVIANMNLGFGDLSPMQLRRVRKETGDMYVLTTADMMRQGISAKDAMVPIPGGPGAQVDSWLGLMKYRIDAMRDLTGISAAVEAGSGQKPELVGLMEGEMLATSNAMYPQKYGLVTLKEQAGRKIAAKARVVIEFSEKSREYYKGAVGSRYITEMLLFKSLSLNQMGVRMRAAPTQERKRAIMEAAAVALNSGRNGVPLIDMDDYLFIEREINNGYVENAAYYLSMVKSRNQERQARKAQQDIQANAEAQIASAQAAEQSKRDTLALIQQMKTDGTLKEGAQKTEMEVLLESLRHDNRMAELVLEGRLEKEKQVEISGQL